MHYQHPTYKRLSYCGFKNRDRTDKFEEVECQLCKYQIVLALRHMKGYGNKYKI